MDGNYDKTADFATAGDLGLDEFLQAITGGGPVNIVAITPDAPKGTGVQGWTGRVDTNRAAIAAMPAKAGPLGRNLHFALNEPRAELIGQMGKWAEDDFAFLRGVAVDLDPREKEEREPGGYERERERLLSLAAAFTSEGPCPASVAIDSGNGVQLIWLFAELVENTPESRALVKAQAAGLADALGGDAVQSVDHLFRLPGTRNFPNAKKRAKGRGETAARLLHLDVSRRYTLDSLSGLAPPREAKAAASVDLADFDYPAVLEAAEGGPDALSQALQARVAELRERRGFAAAMDNPDRSERDYALTAQCINIGMTDPTEIGCVAFALSPQKLQEKEGQGRGEDYASRTISRALERASHFEVIDGGEYPGVPEGASPDPAQPKEERGFRLVMLGEVEDRDPEYLVADLIETDSLVQVFGDPGAGKSFYAIDLAGCIASGRSFHGRAVKQGPVVYVAGEGQNGIKRRFRAWGIANGEDVDAIPIALSKSAAALSDPAAVAHVAAKLAEVAAVHGAITMIVVDTLARNFGGGDENDTRDMNRFVAALDRLRAPYPGCVVLIVHHTGHSDKQRARGAKSLHGALDAEYRVEKVAETMTVTNTKMKEGPQPSPLHFRMKTVQVGMTKDGKPISSLALEPIAAPHKLVVEKVSPGQKLGLRTFADVQAKAGPGAPVHIEKWREVFYSAHTGDTQGTKRQAFKRVREDLVGRGYLSVVDDLYAQGAESWPV